MSSDDPRRANQFALLRQSRFAPFVGPQFFPGAGAGAGHENLFKFGFTMRAADLREVRWLPLPTS